MTMRVDQEFQHTIGDPTVCSGRTKFWIPVVLGAYTDDHMNWVADSSTEVQDGDHNWARSQPNGDGIQHCVGVMEISGEYFWNDIDCSSYALCSVCTVPVVQTFYLRGLRQKQVPKDIDIKYSLLMEMQTNGPNTVFEGQRGLSQITWYPLEKRTVLKRYDNEQVISGEEKLEMMQDPFGLLNNFDWIFTNVRSLKRIRQYLLKVTFQCI